jgi:hypothetical protein
MQLTCAYDTATGFRKYKMRLLRRAALNLKLFAGRITTPDTSILSGSLPVWSLQCVYLSFSSFFRLVCSHGCKARKFMCFFPRVSNDHSASA